MVSLLILKPVQVYIYLANQYARFGKVTGGDGSLENAVRQELLSISDYDEELDDASGVRNVRVMGWYWWGSPIQ